MKTFSIPVVQRITGEAGGGGPHPFFDSREARISKGAGSGCGFAVSGFPPARCQDPVAYTARVRSDHDGTEDEFDLCAVHAARIRTLTGWERVIGMWSSLPMTDEDWEDTES